MRNVLFIILGLGFSGAENVLIQYLEGNEKINPYFAFIFDGNASKRFRKAFNSDRIFEINLPYSKNELRFAPKITQWKLYKKIKPIIDGLDIDVIYFNNTNEVILSRKIVHNLAIPCIGHVHDMKESIGTYFKRHEAIAAFEELDEVITVSNSCKLSWNCPKMSVIYNGLSDDYFVTDKAIRRNEAFTIGFVGMVCKRKGFDILADVIQGMNDNINWRIACNLVADDCKGILDCISKRNNVELFYELQSSEMKSFYDTLDLLVIPSRHDPLPTVAMEAMARKVIVIGNDVDGIPELINNKNLLLSNLTSSEIKLKVESIINMNSEQRTETEDSLYNKARSLFVHTLKRDKVNELIFNVAKEK